MTRRGVCCRSSRRGRRRTTTSRRSRRSSARSCRTPTWSTPSRPPASRPRCAAQPAALKSGKAQGIRQLPSPGPTPGVRERPPLRLVASASRARAQGTSPAASPQPPFEAGGVGWLQESSALQETWLLLEFCDKGSLQDAMDRGAFRSVRIGFHGSVVRPPAPSPRLLPRSWHVARPPHGQPAAAQPLPAGRHLRTSWATPPVGRTMRGIMCNFSVHAPNAVEASGAPGRPRLPAVP